ncbi:thermosome subunit [Candidatus Bathyarchaeota archaeon ex4484_205]|nr:MAG: thermosome subunit [Candidatus Bathyarchaeota archaeon ex4484_205]RLG68354.1 MAG: thermosome subunit [archaeon]
MVEAVPAQIGGQPVLILKEGSSRRRGQEAITNSILVANIMGQLLGGSLGPKGSSKMIIDSLGDITITKSGVTILSEANIEHPIAKMIVEAAKTQDKEVGDGTISAAFLASELVRRAENLLRSKIHPALITKGYSLGVEYATKELGKISWKINPDKEKQVLRRVAYTSLNTILDPEKSRKFAVLAVEAVSRIVEQRGDRKVADIDLIQIVKKIGKGGEDIVLYKGVILDKEVVHPNMPKLVEKAKIALINFPLEEKKTEISAEIRIRKIEDLKKVMDREKEIVKDMVEKIASSGANVVFCQKGINEEAQHYLARRGILAVRRVKKSDMERLSRATGARIITRVEEVTKDALGFSGLVEEVKIGEDKLVIVSKCRNPKATAILLRGETEKIVDEYERAMKKALSTVADIYETPFIVAGGGASEIEIAKRIRRLASKRTGGIQLVLNTFADSVEEIVLRLIENSGLNPVEMLTSLRKAHATKKGLFVGIDIEKGKIGDMKRKGIIEPYIVKRRAIESGAEVANMILRIDEMILAGKTTK